jgi:hypothetical protein
MYLSRFGVKNYKCLGDIDIPLTPIHVLIGQNDCGKTSLLEAMAAFFASATGKASVMFPGPWAGRELLRHGSMGLPYEPDFQVEVSGTWMVAPDGELEIPPVPRLDWRVLLDFEHDATDIRAASAIGLGGYATDYGLERNPSDAAMSDEQARKAEYARDILHRLLTPAHKYSLDAKLMAVPAAIDPSRRFRLDPDGFGLATLLDDILGFDPNLFLQLRADFCRFFPQFKSVRIESVQALHRSFSPDGLHRADDMIGKGIYFEAVSGQTVRAQQASDGAILFLAFLALAYLPDPPSILLIEEPENGIYPARLRQVIGLLRELVNRTEGVPFPQIILTTHSPYVLSFFEPQEVTFLSRPAGEPDAPVRARPLRDAPNIRERLGNDFYLGELWYNLSEGELFGDEACQSCH